MKRKTTGGDWTDFERFTSKGAKIKDPKVTITETGTFLFNAAFVHQGALRKSTHVLLGALSSF